jgi:hypothetical protein
MDLTQAFRRGSKAPPPLMYVVKDVHLSMPGG